MAPPHIDLQNTPFQAAHLPKREADVVFKHFDRNKDRFLDFGELCAGLGLPLRPLTSARQYLRSRGQIVNHRLQDVSPRTARLGTARSARSSRPVTAASMKERANLLQTPRALGVAAATRKGAPTSRSAQAPVRQHRNGPETLPRLVSSRSGAYTPRHANVALAAALSARRKNDRRAQQKSRR